MRNASGQVRVHEFQPGNGIAPAFNFGRVAADDVVLNIRHLPRTFQNQVNPAIVFQRAGVDDHLFVRVNA